MSTSYNYNEELRKQLLKELEEGSDIEDLSKKYHVYISVIENWKKQKESNNFILSVSNEHTLTVKKSWRKKALSFLSNGYLKFLKGKLLVEILSLGLLVTIVIAIFFFGQAEFKFKIKPKVEFAKKIDSLVLISSKIEKKLDEQIKINKTIRKTISTNKFANNTTFYIYHSNCQKKKNVEKYRVGNKTNCSCKYQKDSIQ